MPPDPAMTLGGSLVRSAARYPGKKAVQDDRSSLTYDQFNRQVNRLAQGLAGLGLIKGDLIATLSPNCLELMTLYLAALKLGVVACPLDTRSTASDHAELLNVVQPRGLVYHPGQAGRAEELGRVLEPDGLRLSLKEGRAAGGGSIPALIARGAETEPKVSIEEEDPAFILFTGGTTGTPKGVVLTHRNLMWNAINVISENGSPSPEARICYPMQIYHSGALSRFLATLHAGGTFTGLPRFDPGEYLDTLEREGGTFVVGNTAIWHMLLEENRRRARDLKTVASWLHAQGDISPDFRDRVQRDLFPQAAMYASYALTEAGPGVTVLKPADKPRAWPSIGRPYMSLEVRLADENDRQIPTGRVGQILVRGPNVMSGYYNDPAATREALKGGWLHTGDLGRADDLGFLYFVDRLKDVIKSGGLNVYAKEVEQTILGHPGVREVAVIGVPHPKWGESVRAVVVPGVDPPPVEAEIIEYCRERLAGYKKPTSVIFTSKLPKDSFGGKIKKRQLRETYGRS